MKDCFGLHGPSAFGYVANKISGVGRKSATSGGLTTDLVYWLQAGKTVDILRCAAKSTDLLPPSALPRLLRSLRLFPPARPAAGRLPAAAGHRAAVVILDALGGYGTMGVCANGCVLLCLYHCLCSISNSAIGVSLLYEKMPLVCYSAIGDSETFDDSRLTAKMGVSGMRMSCKARSIEHSTALERLCCGSGGR